MSKLPDENWGVAIGMFAGCVIAIPIFAHIFPNEQLPGSTSLVLLHALWAVLTGVATALVIAFSIDPYPFCILYSCALMVLCTEVWFREDPLLWNGRPTKGWPFFLFHAPGAAKPKAVVPMAAYTRIFSSWHAGGTCVCFFLHVLARDFEIVPKTKVSLGLGLLWFIWAAINSWRTIYGGGQFCQSSIIFHSLLGPGCGLAAYWQLWFWAKHGVGVGVSEAVCLGYFGLMCLFTFVWLLVMKRERAVTTTSGVVISSDG